MENYYCPDCGRTFDEPHVYTEMHGFTYGPGESWSVCPYCGDSGWVEAAYCEECGEPHPEEELTGGLCEACYAELEVDEREDPIH